MGVSWLRSTSGKVLTRLLSHSRLATSERRLARGHWEDMRTSARRNRNIFQDPGNVDSELKVRAALGVSQTSRICLNMVQCPSSVQSLYSSSRFNDDEDDESSYGAPVECDLVPEAPVRKKSSNVEDVEESLPAPKKARVTSAEFIKSSVTVDACPPPVYPEFAVIGRSNVGKSSLINMLTGRNSLAMVSKTPGKTKCINHFFISKSWYLVDLPGYSYAKTSRANIMMWNKFTREYFAKRETLVNVFLLVDASIPPMEIDISCANWFGESEIPFTIVYTKLDKKKKGCSPSEENIAAFEERLLESFETLPVRIRTSSKAGQGKNELLNYIAQMRALFHSNE